jgi:hypothetical protein
MCHYFHMRNSGGLKRQTFAEIVSAVESAPVPVAEKLEVTPGLYSGEVLHDLAGHPLHEVDDHALDADEIRASVLAGALLVWDSCGCGGYCNTLQWPEAAALRQEASKSAPRFRKKQPARVTRMTGAGGDVLLVAGDLRWGDLFR